MFGDSIVNEVREANEKLHEELTTINDTLDDINHN